MSGSRYQRVAASADLVEGQVIRVEVRGRAVAVARVDGALHAVSDGCTHEEASLAEGWVEGHTIECPHHGALFDLRDGRALCLPATSGLTTYPVQEREGAIFIGLRACCRSAADQQDGARQP